MAGHRATAAIAVTPGPSVVPRDFRLRRALSPAASDCLARGFPDKDYGAVAAVHTRNDAGEIHFHAHVLVEGSLPPTWTSRRRASRPVCSRAGTVW
ncbi:MAG TPA: hypothetical protein VGP74_03685 [Rubrobacteraceae bacterium]|nr:hypothetical protein [Rubrobacteraceae bacterium]